MSSQIMGSGLKPISEYIRNSVAPSTLAGYQSAWLLWLSFLNSIREPAGSFSENLVLLFLNFHSIKDIHGLMCKGPFPEFHFFLSLRIYLLASIISQLVKR